MGLFTEKVNPPDGGAATFALGRSVVFSMLPQINMMVDLVDRFILIYARYSSFGNFTQASKLQLNEDLSKRTIPTQTKYESFRRVKS